MFMSENRLGPRYPCSQRAVLSHGQGAGAFGIITNISSGGVCVALVGSSKLWPMGQVQLQVGQGHFSGQVLASDALALHCRFDQPITDPGVWRALAPAIANDSSGLDLERIYGQGCFAALDQLDPDLDSLDATIAAINPYSGGAPHDSWARGFRDGLGRRRQHHLTARGRLTT